MRQTKIRNGCKVVKRKRGGWEISDQKTTVFDGGAVRGDSSGKSLFFFFCHISVSLLTCIYPCFDIRNQYLCHKIMWHKFISQEFYSKEFDSRSKCGDHAMSYNLIQGRNQYPDFGD